ncbi:MAG: SIS domain-containing protein [Actinobacteria bacterium]|nr:SIS domain-containing protein [Actinomycetota bacterium]
MATGPTQLLETASAAFGRRVEPVAVLANSAEPLAIACHAMAGRFLEGGTLIAFGNGGPTTDAQHVSVEFVHPVIVGKRALPAISLNADAASFTSVASRHGFDEVYAHTLRVVGRPTDIALGLSHDGDCRNVLRGLEAAHEAGLLTIALVGGDGGAIADSGAVDHVLLAASDDPLVVKEAHVTTYHVLWELVHVFLEQPDVVTGDASAAETGPDGLGELYPFLYEGGSDIEAVLEEVAASSRDKVAEVVQLRTRTGEAYADELARAAAALGESFRRGGRLLSCGNGGSSSDAQEVARVHLDPPHGWSPVPALCLTNDVAVITALSNDVDFEVVFSRQVRAFGRPGDAFVALSTSGNSPNLIRAFEAAREIGMVTVGFAGGDGGTMASSDAIDHLFVVPSASVHRIQEVQTTLYHVLRELTAAAMTA